MAAKQVVTIANIIELRCIAIMPERNSEEAMAMEVMVVVASNFIFMLQILFHAMIIMVCDLIKVNV